MNKKILKNIFGSSKTKLLSFGNEGIKNMGVCVEDHIYEYIMSDLGFNPPTPRFPQVS